MYCIYSIKKIIFLSYCFQQLREVEICYETTRYEVIFQVVRREYKSFVTEKTLTCCLSIIFSFTEAFKSHSC